eukprot:11696380-Alexandrium_andersonii.AAC.1
MQVSSHVRRLVADSCSHTWITVQGSSELHATSRGTEAGDPIGDLLFTVAATRVLSQVRDELAALGMNSKLSYDPQAGPFL